MIVTRQRKKRFPWKRVLIPLVLIGLIAGAIAWTPSRTWIATGPLSPIWKPVAAPFDGLAESREIASQNAQIASLQKQLSDAQTQIAQRDKQISQLQTQLNDSEVQAALAKSAKPAAVTAQASEAPANDLSAQGTPDMRRTAAVWAAMDAESAAKVVQKLPQDYVARVFALMSPDAVGAILENVPASYAAHLTQEHPELRR
jgi:flagellar motility protein MotE (MotC chaperone)